MTRINIIPPYHLSDQHLIAEHKEILQLCGSYRVSAKSKRGIRAEDIPEQFTLNTGHVKFFYNKMAYIHERFLSVKREMARRQVNSNVDMDISQFIKNGHYNLWTPDKEAYITITQRIREKIEMKPEWYTWMRLCYVETKNFQFINKLANLQWRIYISE